MKLIIDIPEEIYELITNDKSELKGLAKAVKNGIPLEQIRNEIERATIEMDYDTAKEALDTIDKYK